MAFEERIHFLQKRGDVLRGKEDAGGFSPLTRGPPSEFSVAISPLASVLEDLVSQEFS